MTITLPRRNSKVRNEGSPFFPVKDVPTLRSDTMAETGDRYLVHGITDKILGHVSKGYEITTYADTSKSVQDFLNEAGIPFELQFSKTTNGGKKFVESYAFPQFTTNLASFRTSTALDTMGKDIDKIVPRLVSRNSYNKSFSNSFEIGLWRIVCANGKVLPYKDATARISLRHNAVANASLVQDFILSGLEKSTKFIGFAYDKLNQENGLGHLNKLLNAKALSDTFKKAVLDKLVGHVNLELDVKTIPGARGETIEWDIKKVDTQETAWAIYNVATEVATHNIKSPSEQDKSDKALAQIFLADIVV